jgi:four helix bundle suffix protein
LDELLPDFQDFLRQRNLPLWTKDSFEAAAVRTLSHQIIAAKPPHALADCKDAGDSARYALYALWLQNESAEVRANTLVCLIHQANYLLDQQLIDLEQTFIETGGFSEQLAAARIAQRQKDRSDQSFPHCPQCGQLMGLRTARLGKMAGTQFWGCTAYPDCKRRSAT